jgi:hypothetical protein
MTDKSMEEREKQRRGKHNPSDRTTARGIGGGVGGVGGAAAGAAVGAIGGPIGAVIGAIAGAAGGWWAGKEVADATATYSDDDDRYYRKHFESAPDRSKDLSYDAVRHHYQLGHVAGANPDYRSKKWEEVEPELRRGWTSDLSRKHGDWDRGSAYTRTAFERRKLDSGQTGAAFIATP